MAQWHKARRRWRKPSGNDWSPRRDACPMCNGKTTSTHHPAYQEYPGASAQDGYTHVECPKCGWDRIDKDDLRDFNYVENRRGW